VIKLRHEQASLWEGLFAKEVAELWEPWMQVADGFIPRARAISTCRRLSRQIFLAFLHASSRCDRRFDGMQPLAPVDT
jgi:hypothetical protein